MKKNGTPLLKICEHFVNRLNLSVSVWLFYETSFLLFTQIHLNTKLLTFPANYF